MDAATAVVTVGIVVIVAMQAVLIALVLSTRSMIAGSAKALTKSPEPSAVNPAPRDNRFPPRSQSPQLGPQQQRPPRPEAPRAPLAPATPAIDKSLRDINLRLKSAEKNQERARQEIRTSASPQPAASEPRKDEPRRDEPGNRRDGGRDGRPRDEGRDRGDRDRGRDRDHDRDRGDRGDRDRGRDRDHDRDRGRDGGRRDESRRDGNRGPRPYGNGGNGGSRPEGFEPRSGAIAQPTAESPRIQPIAQPQPVSQPQVVAASPVDQGEIEHGRRVAVKRRVLSAEEKAAQDQSSAAPQESSLGEVGEPTFGRR